MTTINFQDKVLTHQNKSEKLITAPLKTEMFCPCFC